MDEQPLFLTDDHGARLHPVDEAVRNPAEEEIVPITSLEQLEALAEMAHETMMVFQTQFQEMTLERAQFVRLLRVDGGHSWRSVADACDSAWDGDWGSNQLAGMALCQRAAQLHGEDYMSEPWN